MKTLYYSVKVQSQNRNTPHQQRSSTAPRIIETPSAPGMPSGSPGGLCTFPGTRAGNCIAAQQRCTSAVEILMFLKGFCLFFANARLAPQLKSIWLDSDLYCLDGSSSSVLPEDFDHLVLRQRHWEMKQQTGSDCRAEKVRGRREWSTQRGSDWFCESGSWGSYLIQICRGLRNSWGRRGNTVCLSSSMSWGGFTFLTGKLYAYTWPNQFDPHS